jgi:VWFA-related protein
LIAGLLLSLTLAAQGPGSGPERPHVISVDVELVNVLFNVKDGKGRSVQNLKQDNFRVFEDNRAQTITNFSSEGSLPLTIALLIDTSSSVRDNLPFEEEAAIEFFQTVLTGKQDQGLVLGFHTGVDLIQDYTSDNKKLASSIRTMRAGGSTALFDAIHLAANEKLVGQNGRRIIVVISDGDDTASRVNMMDALESAQRHDAVIYAISTNSPGLGGDKNKKGDEVLKKFTSETGGRVFFPSRVQDLPANFRDITEELRFQYAIAYRSSNTIHDGLYRKIRLESKDRKYTVRSRNGYYAPKRK